MSLFTPISDRLDKLKLPRYTRFDSPSPTRRHKMMNVAACGRCSRTTSVPPRLSWTDSKKNVSTPNFNAFVNHREKVRSKLFFIFVNENKCLYLIVEVFDMLVIMFVFCYFSWVH